MRIGALDQEIASERSSFQQEDLARAELTCRYGSASRRNPFLLQGTSKLPCGGTGNTAAFHMQHDHVSRLAEDWHRKRNSTGCLRRAVPGNQDVLADRR